MKVALVHDRLDEFGGAERVLSSFGKIFPQAHLYIAFGAPDLIKEFRQKHPGIKISASWLEVAPRRLRSHFGLLQGLSPLI